MTDGPGGVRTSGRRVDAILFDLDGVLVDSAENVSMHWEHWAIERGIPASEVMTYAYGRRTRDTVARFAPALDPVEEAASIEAAQLADTRGVHVVDGAAELIQSVHAGRFGIVTSGSRDLATGRLRIAGLPIPEVLVTAEDVGRGKPHPDAYLEGAGRLGVPSEAVLVVEDAPAGIEAAVSAGMDVIAVTTTHPAAELRGATAVVESLAEIPLLVARCYGTAGRDLFKKKGVPAETSTVRSRIVYTNQWMSVREDEIVRADGSAGIYGVVDKVDFVVVVPFDGQRLWLVEQYRYPVGRRCCEFPQGSWELSAEADPVDVARGELREETGLEAGKLERVGFMHTAHGFCSQGCHVYYATELQFVGRALTPEEVGLEVVKMMPAEFEASVLDGTISDSISIAAYAMVMLRFGRP